MAKDIAIDARGVWKIFGANADKALAAIHSEGLSKAEVLERYNCVVGVADASFEIERGELFCVMGLSGSGKSTLVRHVNRLLEPTAGQIIIGGLFVSTLAMPLAWGALATGVGTAGLVHSSNQKYRRAQQFNYASVESSLEFDDPKYLGFSARHVSEARQHNRIEKFVAPLGFVGGRLTIGAIKKVLRKSGAKK